MHIPCIINCYKRSLITYSLLPTFSSLPNMSSLKLKSTDDWDQGNDECSMMAWHIVGTTHTDIHTVNEWLLLLSFLSGARRDSEDLKSIWKVINPWTEPPLRSWPVSDKPDIFCYFDGVLFFFFFNFRSCMDWRLSTWPRIGEEWIFLGTIFSPILLPKFPYFRHLLSLVSLIRDHLSIDPHTCLFQSTSKWPFHQSEL